MVSEKKIIRIAEVAHEINRIYCESLGDNSQVYWKDAPDWQRSSCINGVRFCLENPDTTPEQSHENWLREKIKDGWVYGPEKNVERKEHPCIRPYNDLPPDQKTKDHFFSMVVKLMKNM